MWGQPVGDQPRGGSAGGGVGGGVLHGDDDDMYMTEAVPTKTSSRSA